jgi:hypothetical protein
VGLLAYLVWGSRAWPLVHDAPLMHYVAWLIAQGAVPYRDVFDMNFPGVYLIHLTVLAVGGAGDPAWRLFDLGWLGATAALVFAYGRGLGDRWSAAAAALLFCLYHLAGGAWRAGQRDFLLCGFLLAGAYGVARSRERGGDPAPLLWGGLALGAGMTVKPHAGLFWVACAAAAALGNRRAGRSPLGGAAIVLAAGLVVPALVFGWLAWRGGWHPFVSIFTSYVLPLYGQVGRDLIGSALGWHRYGWQLWMLLGLLALLGLAARVPGPHGMRRGLALLGVAYGAIHFVIQGKGWEYHLYPLALFVAVLGSAALRPPAAAGTAGDGGGGLRRLGDLARPAAALVLAGTLLVLGAKGVDALDDRLIAEKSRRVASLTRDLRPLAPPGATVQTMDVTEGAVHALLRLGIGQPTRFMYDFHFFHHEQDPRIQALRAEFAAALEAGRPAAIVVVRDTWRRSGYERLEAFPAVARLLARDYVPAVAGDGYRIYAKRAGS